MNDRIEVVLLGCASLETVAHTHPSFIQSGSTDVFEVRRDIWQQLDQLPDPDITRKFKGALWALLTNPEDLTDRQTAIDAPQHGDPDQNHNEGRKSHILASLHRRSPLRWVSNAQPHTGLCRLCTADDYLHEMDWVKLGYSANQIKNAGKVLRNAAMGIPPNDTRVLDSADTILKNWRSSHSYALNAAQNGLRSRIRTACDIDSFFVAQRLKERRSIIQKLVRRYPSAQLSTMQDIAGVRAVVPTIDHVYMALAQIRRTSRHEPIVDDYIKNPQESGYRAVHVIMVYTHRPHGGTRQVEIQLRSQMQHDWADGVETLGKQIGHDLKQCEGPEEALEFLRLISEAFALADRGEAVPAQLMHRIRSVQARMSNDLREGKP